MASSTTRRHNPGVLPGPTLAEGLAALRKGADSLASVTLLPLPSEADRTIGWNRSRCIGEDQHQAGEACPHHHPRAYATLSAKHRGKAVTA